MAEQRVGEAQEEQCRAEEEAAGLRAELVQARGQAQPSAPSPTANVRQPTP